MLTFVMIAGGAALLITILVVWPLLAGRGAAPNQDSLDAQVFRDQLAEIDRDRDRGLINPNEAEGAKLEVSRRLLAADARAQASGVLKPAPQGLSMVAAAVALLALPMAAAGLYAALGAPGMPDQPIAARATQATPNVAERPNQAEAERLAAEAEANQGAGLPKPQPDATVLSNIEQLRNVLKGRPDDAEGHRLLAISLMAAGDYAGAHKAFATHLGLATDPPAETWTDYAEALILAAGGYVSPEAEKALGSALNIDARYPKAMFYAGVSLRQSGRLQQAGQVWAALLRDSPADAPWRSAVEQALAELAPATVPGSNPGRATPGGAVPAPNRDDANAVMSMTPEQQQEFMAARIAELEERLTSEGGEVEEWARLMFVYNQLGKPDEAKRVYGLAVAAQGEKTAKSFLKEQAILLGLEIE